MAGAWDLLYIKETSGNSDNCTKKGRAAFRKRNTMCVKSIDGVKDLVPSDDLCEIPTNAAFS